MCEECEPLAKEKVREEKTECNCGCTVSETRTPNRDKVRGPRTGGKPSS